ncbi:MAG: response regulator [Prolixibacteraceae bacterium]|nr:response regulator [Prolixibacteraceae bacterium]
MDKNNKIKIFLVDDDTLFLKMLEIEFLENGDFDIETYVTGELCVANLSNKPDIIILDYFLDGIDKTAKNGIAILDKILEVDSNIPVIMLSCQDKIEVAVECMHHKAVDYVVKSETAFMRLKKIITDLMKYRKLEKTLNWYMDRI